MAAIYGGDSMNDQRRLLASGVDIVVATPGRLIAFLEGNEISFKDLKTVCIDEADTML